MVEPEGAVIDHIEVDDLNVVRTAAEMGAQMASDAKTVAFVVDQIATAGVIQAKPMFGEYGLHCDGKMVALICDDQLFVKPTAEGRAFAGAADEAPPYPGAKPCLLIDTDRWEDGEWLTELIRISAAEAPLPKPKRRKA